MNEQTIIKKQLLKNMLYSFIAFTIIFTIFGITIFNNLKTSLYQSADNELYRVKKQYTDNIRIFNINTGAAGIPETIASLDFKQGSGNAAGAVVKDDNRPTMVSVINPRVIYIIRDENGRVLNQTTIGRFYEEYETYITFNNHNLDKIYETQVNGYLYRGINFKIENDSNEAKYAQLLINVDAEKNIIDNYLSILTLGIIITITLSIIASYILSKYSLKPIIESWKKQTEFVQNASHELRTPLTIIQAKQELLLQEPNSKIIDKSEDISLTLNEAKRLGRLTKDLMVLARGDNNEDTLKKENVNIDELIGQIIVPYKEVAGIAKKKIELKLEYGKEILADRNKLHQLIVILLDNAIKYTAEGEGIMITTFEKDNRCVIEVKDIGIGVSEETIEHAFDRFYREDKARTREKGGSGLGLSIAHYIVDRHGGNIRLSHNEPKGTIVTVRLPR